MVLRLDHCDSRTCRRLGLHNPCIDAWPVFLRSHYYYIARNWSLNNSAIVLCTVGSVEFIVKGLYMLSIWTCINDWLQRHRSLISSSNAATRNESRISRSRCDQLLHAELPHIRRSRRAELKLVRFLTSRLYNYRVIENRNSPSVCVSDNHRWLTVFRWLRWRTWRKSPYRIRSTTTPWEPVLLQPETASAPVRPHTAARSRPQRKLPVM